MTNSDLFDENGKIPVVTNSSANNGVTGYTNRPYTEDGNIITYSDTTTSEGIFYQPDKFVGYSHIQGLYPKVDFESWTRNTLLFFTSAFRNVSKGKFSYGNKFNRKIASDMMVKLPTNNSGIDFDFMESFIAELEAERIAELEAYLTVSGLDNYELSDEELKALREHDSIDFEEFEYQEVFDMIVQGRRLKKDDQILGDIPFVMSGVTNTGIVNYISNPVASFPENSITLDIFGNAFYRPYAYGAGDDTGVYWNEENEYSKEVMLYITSSMSRSVAGKYDYGNKLRSSKSKNIKMKLPAVSKGVLDTDYMRIITNAVMKLAIKDVVEYTNERIETTKGVVTSHHTNY